MLAVASAWPLHLITNRCEMCETTREIGEWSFLCLQREGDPLLYCTRSLRDAIGFPKSPYHMLRAAKCEKGKDYFIDSEVLHKGHNGDVNQRSWVTWGVLLAIAFRVAGDGKFRRYLTESLSVQVRPNVALECFNRCLIVVLRLELSVGAHSKTFVCVKIVHCATCTKDISPSE